MNNNNNNNNNHYYQYRTRSTNPNNSTTSSNNTSSCGIQHWLSIIGSIILILVVYNNPLSHNYSTVRWVVSSNGSNENNQQHLEQQDQLYNNSTSNNSNSKNNTNNITNFGSSAETAIAVSTISSTTINRNTTTIINLRQQSDDGKSYNTTTTPLVIDGTVTTITTKTTVVEKKQEYDNGGIIINNHRNDHYDDDISKNDNYHDDTSAATNNSDNESSNDLLLLFHVRHPITGKLIISRYGSNYTDRSQRFPSVEQRIQIYMSNWYLPACHATSPSAIRYTNHYMDTYYYYYYPAPPPNLSSSSSSSSDIIMDPTPELHETTTLYINIGSCRSSSSSSSNNNNHRQLRNTVSETSSTTCSSLQWWNLNSIVKPDVVFYINATNIVQAASNNSDSLLYSYSTDVNTSILPTMERLQWNNYYATTTKKTKQKDSNIINNNHHNNIIQSSIPPPSIPLLIQYGDRDYCLYHSNYSTSINNIPIIKKFRQAFYPDRIYDIANNQNGGHPNVAKTKKNRTCIHSIRRIPQPSDLTVFTASSSTKEQVESLSLQPIIWKLNTVRHYGHIKDIDKFDTIPYPQKKSLAVFRGAMTGRDNQTWDRSNPDYINCQTIPRCNFVMMYSSSSSSRLSSQLDIKLTGPNDTSVDHPWELDMPISLLRDGNNTPTMQPPGSDTIVDKLSNTNTTVRVQLKGKHMSIKELLKYKIIIILEGNDVSSGLKWALYSSCVVVMVHPVTVTSWAMEELLEPYVHFVPIRPDFTDLQDAIDWIFNHEQEAMYISYRATQWIQDLLNHPEEDTIIQDSILRRYRSNFFYYPPDE